MKTESRKTAYEFEDLILELSDRVATGEVRIITTWRDDDGYFVTYSDIPR